MKNRASFVKGLFPPSAYQTSSTITAAAVIIGWDILCCSYLLPLILTAQWKANFLDGDQFGQTTYFSYSLMLSCYGTVYSCTSSVLSSNVFLFRWFLFCFRDKKGRALTFGSLVPSFCRIYSSWYCGAVWLLWNGIKRANNSWKCCR